MSKILSPLQVAGASQCLRRKVGGVWSDEELEELASHLQLAPATKREVLTLTLTGAWHALKSYEYGNSATELAAEMARAIERGARMLNITIEGML